MHRKVQMRILGIALLAIGIALVPACKKDADRNDPKPTIVGSDNGRQADDSADSVGETAADSNAQSDAQAKESNGVRPIEKSAEEHQIRIKSWQEPPRKAKFSPIPAQSNLGDNHLLDEVPDSSFSRHRRWGRISARRSRFCRFFSPHFGSRFGYTQPPCRIE